MSALMKSTQNFSEYRCCDKVDSFNRRCIRNRSRVFIVQDQTLFNALNDQLLAKLAINPMSQKFHFNLDAGDCN